MLTDNYNRQIDYLRISVTDKCNLRCRYCMPEGGVEMKPYEKILRWEEICRMVKIFHEEGIEKVRITGGEPLVRKGILSFIDSIKALGIKDLSITTNGILLNKMAADLKSAGIDRVNISLDSLNPDKYSWITRGGDVTKVMQGIEAAFQAGFDPIKLNTVLVRGFNDDEVLDLALLSREYPLHVRFIELMPVGNENIWGKDSYISTEETMDRIKKAGELLTSEVKGNGPAEVWRLPDAKGTIGFISAISNHFCASCNRLRLTFDGMIYPCLHGEANVDCFEILRSGKSDDEIRAVIKQALQLKPVKHLLGSQGRMMNTIGG